MRFSTGPVGASFQVWAMSVFVVARVSAFTASPRHLARTVATTARTSTQRFSTDTKEETTAPAIVVNEKAYDECSMDDIVGLCKRRGFIFPSSEIYNGYAGFYDYGPLGSELKKNIKDAWWRYFVQRREDVVGLDSSIIHNPTTWKSSGEFCGKSDEALFVCRVTVLLRNGSFLQASSFLKLSLSVSLSLSLSHTHTHTHMHTNTYMNMDMNSYPWFPPEFFCLIVSVIDMQVMWMDSPTRWWTARKRSCVSALTNYFTLLWCWTVRLLAISVCRKLTTPTC